MALKKFNEQKFRKKDGMPYGFKPMEEEDTREAQFERYKAGSSLATQSDKQLYDEDTLAIAELRKAKNNPNMQSLINSPEYKQKQKEYSQRAVELAKSKTSSNSDADNKPNAGDNRTTAYQSSVGTTDLGTLPKNLGMRIAESGTDIVNKTATNIMTSRPRSEDQTISKEESLKHATEVYAPYANNKEVTDLFNEYVDWNDKYELDKSGSLIAFYSSDKKRKKAKEEIQNLTGLSNEDFDLIAENYSYLRHNELRKEQQSDIENAGFLAKGALTIGSALWSTAGNFMSMEGALQNTNDPELGRDYNSPYFYLRNLSSDTKEAVHKNIDDSTMSDFQKVISGFSYDAFTMGAESAVSALAGEAGLASFFAGGYASALEEGEERGLTKKQAQAYALVSGGLEYATEKIPFENLRSIYAGEAVEKELLKGSLKPYVKAFLKQSGEEAAEEVVNGLGDLLADSIINADKSKLNISINNYVEEGYSEEDAMRKAFMDEGQDILYAAATAFVSTGASAGPALGAQAYGETSTGRKIVENSDSYLNNAESPEYIADTREAYNSDEDYNQALETRQKLQQVAEQAAQKKKVSGKAARAITSGVREAYDSMNAKAKAVFQQQVEAAQKETEQKAIERVEKTSSAAELETIKEENIKNESIVAAVEEKESQLVETGKVSEEEFAQAITPSKAREIAKSGEEIKTEELEQLPKEVQDAYKVGYSEKVHEVTQNISNEDITKINYSEEGKSKTEAIKSVTSNKDQIVFETESGAKVPASEVRFNDKAKYLYNRENGILSLDNPELVQMAIDIEAKSQNGISVANVTTPLKTMYTAGESGISFDEAYNGLKIYSNAISKDILQNAYNEGAKQSVARNRATTNVRKGRGLIVDAENNESAYVSQFVDSKGNVSEEVRAKYENEVTDTEKKFLELFSKKIGVDIKFTSDNSGNRGEYKPSEGAIYLNLNNGINMFEVALHEGIGEFLAASNEKAYNQIADSVLSAYAALNSNKLASDIRAYQKAYQDDKYGDTARGASRELFNDAIGEILSSESNLKKMFDWIITNEGEKQAQTVKKTLVDYFHDLVDMIKSIKKLGGLTRLERNRMRLSEEQANKYADMIFKAMDEAIANRDAAVNNMLNAAVAKNNSITPENIERASKYADTSDINDIQIDRKYTEAVDNDLLDFANAIEAGTNKAKEFIVNNRVSERLASDIKGIVGFDVSNFEEVLGKNAVSHIFAKHGKNGKSDHSMSDNADIARIRYILANYDEIAEGKGTRKFHNADGSNAKTVILMQKIGDKYHYVVEAVPDNKSHRLQIVSAYINEKDTLPRVANPNGFAATSETDTSDSASLSTSSLTPETEKSSTTSSRNSIKVDTNGRSLSEGQQNYFSYSKVVDEDGKLKVVYHGTMNNFTVFDLSQARDTEDIEAFFFSGDYDESNGYGNVGEYYLNITNPADYDTAYDIFFKHKGEEHAGRLAREELEVLGYDGVIAVDEDSPEYTEYLAFYPEQIKRTDNSNPTDNEDTRKSIKVDLEYEDALKANDTEKMQQLVEQAAQNAGYDVTKLYHGTNHFGFTFFDKEKLDDKNSIFVAEDLKVASSYTNAEAKTKDVNSSFKENIWDLPDEEVWKLYNKTFNDSYRIPTEKEFKADLDLQRKKINPAINRLKNILKKNDFEEFDKQTFKEAINSLETIATTESKEDFHDAYYILNRTKWDFLDDETAYIFNKAIEEEEWDAISNLYQRLGVERKFFVTKNGLEIDWTNALLDKLERHFKHGIYELYGKSDNPYEIDAAGANWDNIQTPEDMVKAGYNSSVRTRDISEYARLNGYDSVRILNVKDSGGKTEGAHYPSTVRIYFNSNQLKSADPVTYNDKGQVIPPSERFNVEDNDIRFSKKVTDTENKLQSDLQQWDGKNPRTKFEVGFIAGGIATLTDKRGKIILDAKKLIKIQSEHPEMTQSVIERLPEMLARPVAIMDSKSYPSRLVVFGDLQGTDGKTVIAVLEMNPNTKGITVDDIKLASAYGKDNLQNLINTSNVLWMDNKKRSNWMMRTRLQLPVGTSTTSNYIVPPAQQNATTTSSGRNSISVDTDGKKISEYQAEFFKDSKAVDENGNLLVLYHGSVADEKFTEFNLSAKGSVNGRVLGDGFYFTPNRDAAKKWSKGHNNIYKVYLNITNPYYASADTTTPDNVLSYLREKNAALFDKLSSDPTWWGNKKGKENYINEELERASNAESALTWIGDDKSNILRSLGYDGIIYKDSKNNFALMGGEQYVAFYPQQIKKTSNKKPTESVDIRKSIEVDWDSHNNYQVPARTYEDTIFFLGTDEEIEAAEKQDVTVKAYVANIIHSKDFAGLMFTDDSGLQRFLTRSTREGYDWQLSEGRDGVPYGHDSFTNENDDITSYDTWPRHTLAALYNEILNVLPKEGTELHVVREGIAEEGRKSIAVFGDASPYSETINQAEYVSKVLSTLNNQLKGTTVNTDYVMDTVKYILDKYQSTVDEHDLAMELAQFIAYMTQNDNVDYNQMMNYLMNIGDEIIQSSELKDPESERVFKELKKELSSHKIRLSETERKELTARYGGDWKAVFGKLNSAGIKLDSKNGQKMDAGIYNDIANRFREIGGVYLDETVTPVDQIATIIDAIEAMEPTAYEWDGANQMDKALDVATTIIDRYYSMANFIKETNIAKGNEKGQKSIEKAKQAEIQRLRKKQAEWKEKLNEQFAALVEDKKKMVQEQQEFYRKQAEAEKKFRGEQRAFNRKVNMTEKEIEKTAKTLAKMEYQGLKDTEAKRKHKENIVRTCTRLINWMNKPTDARHVPTFLKPALTDMIKSIDFMPASMRKGEDGTISAKKWQESMRKLQQVLRGLNAQSMESMDDSDKYNLALVLNAEDIVVKMEELLNKYNGKADISTMSKEDLKTLSDIMKNISTGISKMNENFMNRRFKHVSDAAMTAMDEMDELKPISNKTNAIKRTAGDFLNLDMLDPYSFFHELGDAASSIMQEFYDGEKIGVEIIREAENFFGELSDELGITQNELRKWENDKKDYTFDGKTITLTPAEIMSLYCSYNREKLDQQERPFEATHHIMSGGIKAKERKIGHMPNSPVVNRNSSVMHLTEAQVFELMNTLTTEQIAYADRVVDYMSTTLAAHGNETSNKISGFSKFLGKKYFPLKTDSNTIATNESNNETGLAGMMRLIHPSFTKSQLDKADNALVLTNFFDVVTEHITGMSNYCAYAMPLSDAMRWYNYAETERNATDMEDVYWRDTRTLKASMEKVKGMGAKQYFENFLRDVNLDPANKGGSKFVSTAARTLTGLGRAKAIALNISVWVQQPTAIVRASDVIEGKYLAQGISKMLRNPKKATSYAQDTNYLCYWKSKGFSDYRVSMGMKEIITGHNTKLQAAQEIAGAPAGLMDDVTWASMYFAAENKIKATTNLDVNSEEYRKQVDELFSEIINQTQVIDSTLRTTQTMRSKSDFEYLANAFKKEPQKSYNMLHRAAFDVYQAEEVEDSRIANKAFRKTLKAFLLTSVVNGMVVAAVQAWRDDDDENYLLKWLKKLTPYGSYEAIMEKLEDGKIEAKEFIPMLRGIWGGMGTIGDNADLFASLPLISEIDSLLKGYEPSTLNYTSILSEAHKTVTTLTSSTATEYKVAQSLAALSDYVTGLGVSNAMRDIRGIWNQSTRVTGLPRIEKSTKDVEKAEKAKETDRVNAVFDNRNLSQVKEEIQNSFDEYIEKGQDESKAWGNVRTYFLKPQFQRQLESCSNQSEVTKLINQYSIYVQATKEKDRGKDTFHNIESEDAVEKVKKWYEDTK